MSGWMARAQATFGRKAEEAPVSFEITCSCGCLAAGTRAPVHQRVLCDQCHRWLFVLPVNPYPVPVVKQRRRKQKAKRAKTQTPVGDATPRTAKSDTEPISQSVAEPAARGEPLSRRLADSAQRTVGAAARVVPRWRKKLLTPFRLVLLGIVIVVAGTAFSVWHRARLDEAERTWQVAREKGRTALKAGDVPTALREFQRAVRAVDVLDRDDQAARMIRQQLREVTAVDQLLSVSLPEMIRNAEETIQANPLGWKERFEQTYKGRWLIMETSLVRVAETGDGDRVVIDCPLVIGTRSLEFTGASAAFRSLDIGETPQRVILAAAVRSCELSESTPAHWVVELDPQSAFLWTDFDLYRRLGLSTGDADEDRQTRLLLTSQSKSIGIGGGE